MKNQLHFILAIGILLSVSSKAQNIADFVSVQPTTQGNTFVLPDSHVFQKLIEVGDPLTEGGTMPSNPDFTAYVPINGSSVNGYLSVNSEAAPGGVTVLDINFDVPSNLWVVSSSEAIDFSDVAGTVANCSGAVTSWGTVISCEEFVPPFLYDLNFDGYNDFGWNVEIDPATKTVIGKHFAMGNFAHENVAIHENNRTVYQGADSDPGYLYKFVADSAEDLSSGTLYVYTGSKSGAGTWVPLLNGTPTEANSTLAQSAAASATVFDGIEDVEIGPDGKVYFAVKGEALVYRFEDSDPLVGTTATMESFVGNNTYDIAHANGVTSATWGNGNDNLAFDGQGNLWVFQDGGENRIWVIGSDHTTGLPNVKLFGNAPGGSEPTGITFSPDYKFMFLSIMHPDVNNAGQTDIAGNTVDFNVGTTMVVALEGNLGETLSTVTIEESQPIIWPNPYLKSEALNVKGMMLETLKIFDVTGKLVSDLNFKGTTTRESIYLPNLKKGTYILKINDSQKFKLIVK
ncbi:MAG: hypothetical protein BM564_12265 [Bacteroidetes bacterium MedPE-SWsnd-G2]|nr:MAG: hypothetical protein BM564_12265 [Bacteroidetes bacterium MedPE-SWsnd-G2]